MQWNESQIESPFPFPSAFPGQRRARPTDSSGESFTRVTTQLRQGLATPAAGAPVSTADVPAWNPGGPLPVPPIAHGEVTTRAHEPQGHGQLSVHATQGWVGPGSAGPQRAQGNRGLATVNPDGSITWTVYGPDMRTILYRQLIAPPGRISPQAAQGTTNRDAQIRENTTRNVLRQLPTTTGAPQRLRPHRSNASGADIVPVQSRRPRRRTTR
jgi:hypothetical protein